MSGLTVGDRAPWFTPATATRTTQSASDFRDQDFVMGGYRAVLFFFGSSRNPIVQVALKAFCAAQPQFAQQGVHFFGISIDPNDRSLTETIPPTDYFHWLWDFTGEISIRYGLCQMGQADQGVLYDPTTFVLNENLQILNVFALETGRSYAQQVLQYLASLPTPEPPRQITQQAPVLLIPQVFPPDFCQFLIDRYETEGGIASGFMQQSGDQTIVTLDPTVKRRRDWLIQDPTLIQQINLLLGRRIAPEIMKAFQFRVTHFERYVVACYESTDQGFFRPHRDNTATGTVHRRFALTLNLNAGYDGGCLRFAEYGSDLYAPPAGSAAVFSCSLLHEATPVTQGRRFVLLSFLYGDEDAQLRQQTQAQIVRSGVVPQGVGNERIQPS
ncbi:MAG: 2OG-Fe(II) oxygenase [Elainella sp. Prado103]|jgi:peroxiredoxin/predicted 2-oxoglutarate/Fe(II)-dependent dioxygenase YbiX|nr:2OG-Fe(II) oxygenase [Elainella sp. Prado103]